jgi:hypothetical protein
MCRRCWHEMTDDQYDRLVDVGVRLFGVTR